MVVLLCSSLLRSMDLGPSERVERKEALRSPAASANRDSPAERERSAERRDIGEYRDNLLHSSYCLP